MRLLRHLLLHALLLLLALPALAGTGLQEQEIEQYIQHGTLERQGNVAHLIAGHLVDLSGLLGELLARSRDFH